MTYDSLDILLIEDNDAELTIRALRQHNLVNTIDRARDGDEALTLLCNDGGKAGPAEVLRPRLILLDIKMPKVDGIEVLERLKTNEQTRDIPVVVLTSSREEQDVVQSYRLGVNSYIVKPVGFQKFTEAAKTLGMYWMLLNHAPT